MSEFDFICETFASNGRAADEAERILHCLDVAIRINGIVSVLTHESRDAFMRALSFSQSGNPAREQAILSLEHHDVRSHLRPVSQMAAEVKQKDPASSIADRILAVLNTIDEKLSSVPHSELASE